MLAIKSEKNILLINKYITFLFKTIYIRENFLSR